MTDPIESELHRFSRVPDPYVVIEDRVVGDFRRTIAERPYGEGAGQRWYILTGPGGAVQFVFMDGVPSLFADFSLGNTVDGRLATDLGWHSPTPCYEGQERMDCDVLVGQDFCYYEGTSYRAQEILLMWAKQGFEDEWMWRLLAAMYRRWTEGVEHA